LEQREGKPSAISPQQPAKAISNQPTKLAANQRETRELSSWFLIRAHSRNSRLLLLDLRPSAEICGDFLVAEF
jgi:hypothetical protein